MKARMFHVEHDYPLVSSWWTAHHWPSVPPGMLPKTGFVVEDETQGYCAGFLYRTDSGFGLLEWVVSNPHSPWEKRSLAIDLLIAKLLERAKELGMEAVLSMTSNSGLLKRYERAGFIVTDTNQTHVIWRG